MADGSTHPQRSAGLAALFPDEADSPPAARPAARPGATILRLVPSGARRAAATAPAAAPMTPPCEAPAAAPMTTPGDGLPAQALVETAEGRVPVAELMPGDRVLTRDHGHQPVLGVVALTDPDGGICIRRGALGAGLPERDLCLAPRQHLLWRAPRAHLLFGLPEVLVAAQDLLGRSGVLPAAPGAGFLRVLCARSELIRADGLWCAARAAGPASAARPVLHPCEAAALLAG